MSTLATYLLNVKSNPQSCHHVVIGNGAADLDSMVAAITYGYLCSTRYPKHPVLPLIYIPRSEFCFRPEAVYLFAEVGLHADELIFIDDVDCETLFKDVSLILVDHNRLSRDLEKYQDQVIAVLDHHRDEGLYRGCEPRIVQKTGSCCSLVVHEFTHYGVAYTPALATLLAGTILLDTLNCDPQANKVTRHDILALEQVMPHCLHKPDVLYEKLKFERSNVGSLGVSELLRRDYKHYHTGDLCWGIAVIPLRLEVLGEKNEDLWQTVNRFITERGLDLLLLMLFFEGSGFRRQLVMVWSGTDAVEQLVSALQADGLELIPLHCVGGKEAIAPGTCYEQINTAVSRKGLQPMVEDFLHSRDGTDVAMN